VVSLCSTTGFKLPSLRDDAFQIASPPSFSTRTGSSHSSEAETQKKGAGQTFSFNACGSDLASVPSFHEAGGFRAYSRWLSEATPPALEPNKPAPRQGASLPRF
jgi:hypothetical protein